MGGTEVAGGAHMAGSGMGLPMGVEKAAGDEASMGHDGSTTAWLQLGTSNSKSKTELPSTLAALLALPKLLLSGGMPPMLPLPGAGAWPMDGSSRAKSRNWSGGGGDDDDDESEGIMGGGSSRLLPS